jgi:hypothetical protein
MTRRQSGSRRLPRQCSPLVLAFTERTPSCIQGPALQSWEPLRKANRSRIDHRPRSFVHFSPPPSCSHRPCHHWQGASDSLASP